MNIHRLIYPGFWFGKSSRAEALTLAHLGVGGFCFYGGTMQEVRELARDLRRESPLEHLFICADYEDGLGRWLPDAPLLPSNLAIGASGSETLAYRGYSPPNKRWIWGWTGCLPRWLTWPIIPPIPL